LNVYFWPIAACRDGVSYVLWLANECNQTLATATDSPIRTKAVYPDDIA